MTTSSVDFDHLSSWIGREETRTDTVDAGLAAMIAATLEIERYFPSRVGRLPVCAHWCLFRPTVGTSSLDVDGHPPRGGFLPPVPLPRRMWAGGQLDILDQFEMGDTVKRCSRIVDVRFKEGSSGSLCFVTVDHELQSRHSVILRDRQDIVYRNSLAASGPDKYSAAAAPNRTLEGSAPAHHRSIDANVTLLFRYSALMFNAHRIHYDLRHATEVEGYDGLVVQGPLQATFLLEFAADVAGRVPKAFKYRGVRPLIAGPPMQLVADESPEGLVLHVVNAAGEITMRAVAAW